MIENVEVINVNSHGKSKDNFKSDDQECESEFDEAEQQSLGKQNKPFPCICMIMIRFIIFSLFYLDSINMIDSINRLSEALSKF